MAAIPSASQKKVQAAQEEIRVYYEEQIQQIEAEKIPIIERAEAAEQRIEELEQESKVAAVGAAQRLELEQSRAAAREKELLDQLKAQELAAQNEAKLAQQELAAVEVEKSGAASRLEEVASRIPPLEEQIKALTQARDKLEERAAGLAEKLAQAQAEKKGVEALAEVTRSQYQMQLEVQEKAARGAQVEAQARLEAEQARLPPIAKQRDEEAAERVRLSTALATSKAESAALAERIPPMERRLKEDVEALQARLEVAEAARDEATRLREASLAEVPPLHAKIAELSAERASLAALVPGLEKRLGEELSAERERSDAHIARAESHTAEARRERDALSQQVAQLRGELRGELEAAKTAVPNATAPLKDKIETLKVELAAWPPRVEAAEARVPPLLEQIERALEEKRGLEPQLSAARAERASLEDLVRRTEVWAEGQIRELRDAALQSHARLEAAAAERLVLLEQKEAAADGWRRSQEALARVEAEKRAAEAVAATSERQVDAANARCAKFEAELRELGASARSACTRVEEMAALQGRTVSVERTIDEKVERERTKLANVLAGERERSQSFVEATFSSVEHSRAGALQSFVEATFLQQQQIVEKQQEALREQRRLYDETHAKQESLARERAAVEQETATAARVAAGAAAAAAAREREALSSSCAPETVTKHTMRASLPSRSAAEIESLLDLQSQIRQASVDVQSSLRHKHVEEVVGAYAETPVPAPSTFAVARSLHDVLAGHR